MKRLLVLLTLVSATAFSQHRLVSSSPVSGTTNVPTHLTLGLTFNSALDTTESFGSNLGYWSNIDSLSVDHYSADKTTIYFKGVCKPDSQYFFAGFSWRFAGGTKLDTPFVVMLTTAPSFTGHTVSGNVTSDIPGISPGGTLVLFATSSVTGGEEPTFVTGAVSSPGGSFSVPWVHNGTWFPVSAIDINEDANIDPNSGDPIAVGDSVIVNNAAVNGLALHFVATNPFSLIEAIDTANVMAASLPVDRVLRLIHTYGADSTGHAQEWQFSYTCASNGQAYRCRVSHFGQGTKILSPSEAFGLSQLKPLVNPGLAALADTIVARCERNGGKQFRHQSAPDTLQFQIELYLGDVRYNDFWDMIPDTSKLYWGAKYTFYRQMTSDTSYDVWKKRYIYDFTTGNLLSTTGVKGSSIPEVPASYSLYQNYPNPFNPSTIISFDVPNKEDVRLTVYSLLGQEVATLISGTVSAGRQEVRFDGSGLSSGVYFFRLATPQGSITKAMLLTK